jgi:hypothetical protein
MPVNPSRPTKSDCWMSTTQLRDLAIRRLIAAGFDAGPGNANKQLFCNVGADKIAVACGIVMSVDSGAKMRHDPI